MTSPADTLNETIWQIIASIPEGKVTSYGHIAKLAGFPNHARYVGSTLRKLPKDTRLPWQRVINAQGKIAFPAGSDAFKRQKARLEAEGVTVSDSGKISLRHFGWEI